MRKPATYTDRNGIPARAPKRNQSKRERSNSHCEMFGPALSHLDRPVPPLLRKEVYQAGGGCCYYCGCQVTCKTRTIDHMIPVSRGGMSDMDNLVLACITCNQAKNNRTVREWSAAGYPGKNTVGVTK